MTQNESKTIFIRTNLHRRLRGDDGRGGGDQDLLGQDLEACSNDQWSSKVRSTCVEQQTGTVARRTSWTGPGLLRQFRPIPEFLRSLFLRPAGSLSAAGRWRPTILGVRWFRKNRPLPVGTNSPCRAQSGSEKQVLVGPGILANTSEAYHSKVKDPYFDKSWATTKRMMI